jgi:cell fate regulator YaaT (PSP1 superfamily)
MTDPIDVAAEVPSMLPSSSHSGPASPHLVEVSFKGNRREFFTWAFPEPPALRTPVIVDADRGEDLGLVNSTGELAAVRKAGTPHGKASPEQLRPALRAATADDIAKGATLREDEDNVRRRAIEKVRAQGLDMKVSDTEWQWDRKKLTIYFTAEKRVDFRQLVRQLEGLFGTRVQMWHIGVRDEARRLDGIGRCARQFCSASWLPELRPVKSSIAKDQRLSTLNPSQISGSCGRLMCCLRYEHEFYVQQRKRFPKEGKIIVTLAGEEKIVSNDIFREQVTLRNATGDVRIVPLAQLNRELGGEPAAAASDLGSTDDETDFDDELPTEPPANRRSGAPANRRAEPPQSPAAPASSDRPGQQPRPRPHRQGQQQPGQPRPDDQRPGGQPRRQAPTNPRAPQAPQQAAQQMPPQELQDPRDPQGNQPQDQQEREPGGEGAGRRRRRRGRRGGRRGRHEGGGPPQSNGAPPAPPAPQSGS